MKLLTPPGAAGIAVVGAVGAERQALLHVLQTRDGAPLSVAPGEPPRRATLQIGDQTIDEVLVVDRGAHGVEVHVHGAPAVVDALRGVFDVSNAVASSPAEDLLWQAMSREQLEFAAEQMACDFDAFRREIDQLPAGERVASIAAARRRTFVARALAVPQRVVLMGNQNAGKSSLFNALLFRERVLTGPQPGLTRDPVAERTTLDGYPYELVDAAGEGPAAVAVDARALEAARAQRHGAVTILVVDRSRGPNGVDRALAGDATLVVANKCDLPAAPWPPEMPCHAEVSCTKGHPAQIRADVGRWLRERRGLPIGGRVGGVAALTADQQRRLDECDG